MEVFYEKKKRLKAAFSEKAPYYMFGRFLNVPLVSSLVFSLRGGFRKQSCWREIRPYYEGFRDAY